jgi:hypothetical protein
VPVTQTFTVTPNLATAIRNKVNINRLAANNTSSPRYLGYVTE